MRLQFVNIFRFFHANLKFFKEIFDYYTSLYEIEEIIPILLSNIISIILYIIVFYILKAFILAINCTLSKIL